MGLSAILKKILVVSLLGAMIVIAAITVEKGVETWAMFGTTCIAGGCVAVKGGNDGGWFGIVAGLLSYLYAGGLQSGQIKSGLRKRATYTTQQIDDGTFLKDNLMHMGFENSDVESLVGAVVHGNSGFTIKGVDYTVSKQPNGRVKITTKHIGSKRDDEEYQAYTDQEIDLVYMDADDMNDWAHDIASNILSNFGDSEAICAEITDNTEYGGYAFAGLQISQAGTDLENDGSCDYANYDKRRAVKVSRRFIPKREKRQF